MEIQTSLVTSIFNLSYVLYMEQKYWKKMYFPEFHNFFMLHLRHTLRKNNSNINPNTLKFLTFCLTAWGLPESQKKAKTS